MEHRKFYAYCRVSSTHQQFKKTIENQVIEIERYLKTNPEIEIIQWYKDDGISGFKEQNRAEFQQMLNNLAENGDIEGIICYDLSRIGRSALNLLQFVKNIEEIDKKLITISGMKIDTTSSTGKFMLTNYVGLL